MSQRIEKVESLVREIVARELIESLGEAGARVTVTGVDVSPDMRNATVWIAILGDKATELWEEIAATRGSLQKRVAETLTTKFVPKLHLKLDTGGEYADHINRILKQI